MNNNFTFIDLFCGIGAFHQAFSSLGGKCVFACDIDKHCRETYEKNYGLAPVSDITKIDEKDIPHFDVLCAGFPCQSFSKAGNRLGFQDPTKGTLFFDVMRIARYHNPEYILLENVRNLATHDNGNTWAVIKSQLREAGYYVQDNPNIFSPHYVGIPQHRERVFIIASKTPYPDFCFNTNNIKQCSIESVLQDDSEIENLDKYRISDDEIALLEHWNEFLKNVRTVDGKLPGFPVWTDCFTEGVYAAADDYPKWKYEIMRKNFELFYHNREFINEWFKRRKNIRLFFGAKAKLEWQAGVDEQNPDIFSNIIQYRPSGVRVKKGTYFPALVAMNQTSIIGEQKRVVTPRECARIQSFPDSFIIDNNDSQVYKQFGNSINVECAKIFTKYMLGDEETRTLYSKETQFPDKLIQNTLI